MSRIHKNNNKDEHGGIFEYNIPPCCSDPLKRIINPFKGKYVCLGCGSEIDWMN